MTARALVGVSVTMAPRGRYARLRSAMHDFAATAAYDRPIDALALLYELRTQIEKLIALHETRAQWHRETP